MRLIPKGNLPRYEHQYSPSGWIFKRPVWYKFTNYYLFLGETGVGKTTMLYEGLHELASCQAYQKNDLDILSKPTQTTSISRFSLERRSLINMVDAWIDIDGTRFTEAFSVGGSYQGQEKNFESILKTVNVMIMTVSAHQILWLKSLNDDDGSGTKIAQDYIHGLNERLTQLFPSFGKKIMRAGFTWRLVVTQCGDVCRNENGYNELCEALKDFTRKTGFNRSTKTAILCESKPEQAEALEVGVAKVLNDPKNGLRIDSDEGIKTCSAGIALGIIIGKIDASSQHNAFIVDI
jgi:hypothetical protein